MRVHSTVGLITNSSSETYTMPRRIAIDMIEAVMRGLHPNVETWQFARVDWDGTDLDKRIIAQSVYDLGAGEMWEDDRFYPFQDTEVSVDDPDTWPEEFKAIVDAVTPVLLPLIPVKAGRETDCSGAKASLHGRLLVVADGQLHMDLSDEATRLACDILYANGRYEYR